MAFEKEPGLESTDPSEQYIHDKEMRLDIGFCGLTILLKIVPIIL